jgi:hypothetical protein
MAKQPTEWHGPAPTPEMYIPKEVPTGPFQVPNFNNLTLKEVLTKLHWNKPFKAVRRSSFQRVFVRGAVCLLARWGCSLFGVSSRVVQRLLAVCEKNHCAAACWATIHRVSSWVHVPVGGVGRWSTF